MSRRSPNGQKASDHAKAQRRFKQEIKQQQKAKRHTDKSHGGRGRGGQEKNK